jgi:hypothetical protein
MAEAGEGMEPDAGGAVELWRRPAKIETATHETILDVLMSRPLMSRLSLRVIPARTVCQGEHSVGRRKRGDLRGDFRCLLEQMLNDNSRDGWRFVLAFEFGRAPYGLIFER